MNQIARDLIAAFKTTERPEAAAVLLREEDGFDNEALRVLSAWTALEHAWKMPDESCPDNGRPTVKAWNWLMSGLDVDHVSIADAAAVSLSTARVKLRSLLVSRLIYPDGTIAKIAAGTIAASLGKRLEKKKESGKKKRRDDDADDGVN